MLVYILVYLWSTHSNVHLEYIWNIYITPKYFLLPIFNQMSAPISYARKYGSTFWYVGLLYLEISYICSIFLDSTYKQNHLFVFCWLISVSVTISKSTMMLQTTLFHSFLWQHNISLYIYTTSSLFIPLLMDI